MPGSRITSGAVRKFLISVVAVVGMVVAGSVSPAAANAALPSGGAVASCASPPDKADATPENRNRFVDLWSARFADSA